MSRLLTYRIFKFSPIVAVGIVSWVAMLYYIDRSIENQHHRKIFRALAGFVSIFVSGVLFMRLAPPIEPGVAAKIDPNQIAAIVAGVGATFAWMYLTDVALPLQARSYWRYICAAIIGTAFFWVMHEHVPDNKKGVEITKAATAVLAAGFVFFEAHRKGQGRPVSERWKKLVGVSLAMVAIFAYFNGFNFGYPRYYHRWDQYHYYMGAKYFPEMGYKNLYRCAVVAQYEMGKVEYKIDRPFKSDVHPPQSVDMREEMKDADKKIRDLPGENLLIPVTDLLPAQDGGSLPPAAVEHCRSKFSDERWEEYKADVAFYRIVSGKGYWTDMQKDHGFNPPPVWTVAGKFLSDLNPASVEFLQFLATFDILYIIGMFIALWWAFGWRVFAAGAIFWGCQSSAPFYWTGGAFLRQDWLFWLVLSTCCIKKGYLKIAGASLVYAALLRIFPGLVVAGTLVPVVVYVIKKGMPRPARVIAFGGGLLAAVALFMRHYGYPGSTVVGLAAVAALLILIGMGIPRMHPDHKQMLIGGTAAAGVLLVVSTVMTHQPNTPFYTPYKLFYEHTIETHDKTPLTNHMGLQVIVAHKFFDFQAPGLRSAEEAQRLAGPNADKLRQTFARIKFPIKLATGPSSGQMQYVRDNKKLDPFEDWKNLRNDRYKKYKWLAYVIIIGTLLFFVAVVRHIKSLWVAQCLGQIFVILGSQLTCYYYSFMILGAPLIKLRRQIELGLYALAAVTEIIWMQTYWNDNKYTLLTIVSLIFCYVMLGFFYRPWRSEPVEARAIA